MKTRKTSPAQHVSFLAHRRFLWLKVSGVLCVLSIVGYVSTDFDPVRNGGTWYGYTLGVIGALLILWLSLLGARKRAITAGHWSLKGWTSAHVYLGVSLIIVATLHSGFQFGWNVHTLAYALMIFVILSGIIGVFFYVYIPRRMSDNRAEMGQMDMLKDISNLNAMLDDAAQPLSDKYVPIVRKAIDKTKLGGSIFRRLSINDARCSTREALTYFQTEMRNVEAKERSEILDMISVLERKNSLLLKIRKHTRYKALLQIWLYVHLPVTFALIAALIAHIISVFYYS
jgi:hypothetical protein